jgi:hypothetical protein
VSGCPPGNSGVDRQSTSYSSSTLEKNAPIAAEDHE